MDLDNRPVLGNDNLPIAIPNGELNISEDGFVSVDGQILGQIGIETIGNTEALRKIGDNLYEMGLDENGEVIPMVDGGDFSGRLLQGHLESSNMNPVDGMVDMITLLREFEANQKVIKMQDEMLEKAATEIARL